MAWEQFEHGWRRAPMSAPAKGSVVLMHGVGSNARDLMPLADIWSESLPDVAFTSLDGTDAFDGGFGGRQWFSLRDVNEGNREARVAAAYPALRRMLEAELAHWQVAFGRLALVGFSQGSIMAMHHVATSAEGAAGVVAYSGRLASAIVAQNGTPLTLVHGEDDEVIPVQRTRIRRRRIQQRRLHASTPTRCRASATRSMPTASRSARRRWSARWAHCRAADTAPIEKRR